MDVFEVKRKDTYKDYIAHRLIYIFLPLLDDFQCIYDEYNNVIYTNYNFKCTFGIMHERSTINFVKFDNNKPFIEWSYIIDSCNRIIFYQKTSWSNKVFNYVGKQPIITESELNYDRGAMSVTTKTPVVIRKSWKLKKGIHPSAYISFLKKQSDEYINEFFNNHVTL